jgi:hypothetical protein
VISKAPAARSEHPLAGLSLIPWLRWFMYRRWRSEHVALIVYDKNSRHQLFLTCVFGECQLLCNARANGCCEHLNRRFTSDLPFG